MSSLFVRDPCQTCDLTREVVVASRTITKLREEGICASLKRVHLLHSFWGTVCFTCVPLSHWWFFLLACTSREDKRFERDFIVRGACPGRTWAMWVPSKSGYSVILFILCQKSWLSSRHGKGELPFLIPLCSNPFHRFGILFSTLQHTFYVIGVYYHRCWRPSTAQH